MSKRILSRSITNREIQAMERRKQILDVARKLFAENGYHATSMRSINKKVGMSDALTYHYFPGGKLEIFNTIIKDVEEERANDIEKSIKAFTDEMSLKEALFFLVKKMSYRFVKDEEFIQIMIQERRLINEEHLGYLKLGGEQFIGSLIKFLSKRALSGEIREMDYTMAISQFMCHVGLVALNQILYETNFDEKKFLKQAENIIKFTVDLWSK